VPLLCKTPSMFEVCNSRAPRVSTNFSKNAAVLDMLWSAGIRPRLSGAARELVTACNTESYSSSSDYCSRLERLCSPRFYPSQTTRLFQERSTTTKNDAYFDGHGCSRSIPRLRDALVIVKVERFSALASHRPLMFWQWKSRKRGRP